MENIKNMTPKLIKELGMRFPTELSKQRSRYGLYECPYCGKHWEVVMGSVKCGDTKSCGCLRGELHGLKGHKLYGTWRQMVQRCTNSKHKNYKNYGGRGIIVCEEWLDIKKFIAWAESTHPNIEGYTLDRIDNDKGYNPDNCRWTDKTTQAINQRIQKNNTSKVLGVSWKSRDKRWVAQISHMGKKVWLGQFISIEDAIEARNSYILVNKLPNPLSVLITK
jgi:hypothetical protein